MEIVFGVFIFYCLGISLFFLILTLKFRNIKSRKWIFGILTSIFFALAIFIPIINKSIEANEKYLYELEKNSYSGTYFNDNAKNHKFILELRSNDSFSFTVDSCNPGNIKGKWKMFKGSPSTYINFYPNQDYNHLYQARITKEKIHFFNGIPLGCYSSGQLILTKKIANN